MNSIVCEIMFSGFQGAPGRDGEVGMPGTPGLKVCFALTNYHTDCMFYWPLDMTMRVDSGQKALHFGFISLLCFGFSQVETS